MDRELKRVMRFSFPFLKDKTFLELSDSEKWIFFEALRELSTNLNSSKYDKDLLISTLQSAMGVKQQSDKINLPLAAVPTLINAMMAMADISMNSYNLTNETVQIIHKYFSSQNRLFVHDKLLRFLQECINSYRQQQIVEGNRILVTATMSAGKSTIVNALIKKNILATRMTAATANTTTIFRRTMDDGLISILHMDGTISWKYLDNWSEVGLSDKKLQIGVGFDWPTSELISLIDTPGINSSQNNTHTFITDNMINKGDFDKVLYVMNATQMATLDDVRHINSVLKVLGEKPLVVALNKVDQLNMSEDSLEHIIGVASELINNKANVVPVSGYAATLVHEQNVSVRKKMGQILRLELLFSSSLSEMLDVDTELVKLSNIDLLKSKIE